MKVRIIHRGTRYFCQYRKFFKWKYFMYRRYTMIMDFVTIEDAKLYLDALYQKEEVVYETTLNINKELL